MRIERALFVEGFSSFYVDDQQAIKNGAVQDGFIYQGAPVSSGFNAIRQAGRCVSVLLMLEDGSTAVGDCAAVQYSGAGGREPLFNSEHFVSFLTNRLRPLLEGRCVDSFLPNACFFDSLKIDGQRLHPALRYGLSQALLDASALAKKCQKVEVLCNEYLLPLVPKPLPLFAQSGDDRYRAVDKMLLKGVDVLPHGLINNIPDKLGYRGEKLEAYIQWLRKRIMRLRESGDAGLKADYQPDLHIDVYGTVGQIFDHDNEKIADYLQQLEAAAGPLSLYIEGPIDAGGRDEQIDALLQLRRALEQRGSTVKLVADEWCNTYEDIVAFVDARCCHMVQIKTPDLGSVHNVVEAVLYCNSRGLEAYQGGTCNETDISARTCVHLALAVRPSRLLVKPGMGFDEGMTIVNNEMQRSIALMRAKQSRYVASGRGGIGEEHEEKEGIVYGLE